MLRIKKRFIILSFLVCCIVSQFCFASVSASPTFEHPTNSAKIIALSDIHFDPFYTCQKAVPTCSIVKQLIANKAANWEQIFIKYDNSNIALYHHDSNYLLLKSALTAAQQKSEEYSADFIIILGDFLSHDFKQQYQFYSGDYTTDGYQNFVKKTLQFLTNEIQTTIKTVPVYPVVGNNDSYDGDYTTIPNGLFFKETAVTWAPLLQDKIGTFVKTFPIAGYYAVTPPQQNKLRVIALNTILFSPKAYNSEVNKAAQQELQWLQQQLTIARQAHQHVWLIFHVPPGINVYNTVKSIEGTIVPFWRPDYSQAFVNILRQNSSIITAILTSHVHMDGFQLIQLKQHIIPDSFVPGISPLFGNNPGFKVYTYSNKSLRLQNFITYYLNETKLERGWQQEYNFNAIYQPNCLNCSLESGMKNIAPTGYLAQMYQRYYAMSNIDAQPITKGKWLPYYWCSIYQQQVEQYKACLAKY